MVTRAFPTVHSKYRSTAAQRAAVRRVIEDTSTRVAQIPNVHLQALVPVLSSAEEELSSDIRRWLASVPNAEERFTMQSYRNLLLQIRGALDTVKRVQPQLAQTLTVGSRVTAAASVENTFDEIARLTSVFGGSLRAFPVDLTRIVASGEAQLTRRFESSAKLYADYVQADIRRQLAIGVAKGESVGKMTTRLQKLGGPKTEDAAEGLFARYRSRAETIVRTELIHAYNIHTDETIRSVAKVVPGVKRRWDAAHDARTCAICRELDGQVCAIGEAFSFDLMTAPAHPRCRCRVGAWREEWKDLDV